MSPAPYGHLGFSVEGRSVTIPVYGVYSSGPGTPVHTYTSSLNLRGTLPTAVINRAGSWKWERDGIATELDGDPIFTRSA